AVTSAGSTSRCPLVPGLAGADATMPPRIASSARATDAPDIVGPVNDSVCAGLLTDKYELTMLSAALRDCTGTRQTTVELFARRLPEGRRYGVVAGTGRFLEALPEFRFDDIALESVAEFVDSDTVRYLRDFQFRGDVDGYAEGELYFPGSPVLS